MVASLICRYTFSVSILLSVEYMGRQCVIWRSYECTSHQSYISRFGLQQWANNIWAAIEKSTTVQSCWLKAILNVETRTEHNLNWQWCIGKGPHDKPTSDRPHKVIVSTTTCGRLISILQTRHDNKVHSPSQRHPGHNHTGQWECAQDLCVPLLELPAQVSCPTAGSRDWDTRVIERMQGWQITEQ